MWVTTKSQEDWTEVHFSKMRLRHEEVIYLGHLISGGALKPSLVKFLSSLLTINEPLRKLSCKDASWTWQSE